MRLSKACRRQGSSRAFACADASTEAAISWLQGWRIEDNSLPSCKQLSNLQTLNYQGSAIATCIDAHERPASHHEASDVDRISIGLGKLHSEVKDWLRGRTAASPQTALETPWTPL